MTDYLSQLAARSLAQADVILPRPSSLFEAAVFPSEISSVVEGTSSEVRVPEPSEPVTRQAATEAKLPNIEATVASVIPPPNSKEQIAPVLPPLPAWLLDLQSLTQKPRSDAPGHPLTPIEVESHPAATWDVPPPSSPAAPTTLSPPSAPFQIDKPSSIAPPPAKIIEGRQTETRLIERIEHKPLVSETVVEQKVVPRNVEPPPATQKSVVLPPQPERQTVVVHETRPYQPPISAPSFAEEPAGQSSPTIHVTIGRVEVRATKPGVKPKERRSPPRSSVMSLDDYLRQRNNGDKR